MYDKILESKIDYCQKKKTKNFDVILDKNCLVGFVRFVWDTPSSGPEASIIAT